ncbi:CemA family protein [Chlorogloeopsis sp. ULAP02]|uniref:CemA family protein n=1 Tax=Chlorogloeopsis sp. ULAP02 TaxID=3107926 RepID=UPI003136BAF9
MRLAKVYDGMIANYTLENENILFSSLVLFNPQLPMKNNDEINPQLDVNNLDKIKVPPVSQKTGVIPRSIGRTINRITADFSPQAEEEFIKNFQFSRNRSRIALRFILMLIIVPLLTQEYSKQFLFSPVVERIRSENTQEIFLNSEMEEEALRELKRFEEQLNFEQLIRKSPPLSPKAIEEKLKEKANEIAQVYKRKSNIAISNIFADILSLLAFALVVVTNKQAIEVVQSFIDEVIYGLSDSAKAFLIILFTDIFVGFHSPHGWEILLEGLAEHLGLPANRGAISLFIATFPVILDTIFKYWIFRYLSRLSPSALATLKEMDE